MSACLPASPTLKTNIPSLSDRNQENDKIDKKRDRRDIRPCVYTAQFSKRNVNPEKLFQRPQSVRQAGDATGGAMEPRPKRHGTRSSATRLHASLRSRQLTHKAHTHWRRILLLRGRATRRAPTPPFVNLVCVLDGGAKLYDLHLPRDVEGGETVGVGLERAGARAEQQLNHLRRPQNGG
eukprot:2220281-Pleurochrysis_carterae.AAC.1